MDKELKDKKIGILGFGIDNQVLATWLIKHGAKKITICDKNPNIKAQISNQIQISKLKFQLGKDYLKNLEQFDIIFRTPGIPYLSPEIQNAKKAGVEISSQIKLFMDLCPCKTIGITGTKGKGTTSTLIYEILKNARQYSQRTDLKIPSEDFGSQRSSSSFDHATHSARCSFQTLASHTNVYLSGNIGNPPIEFLDQLTKNDSVVLELSSFQLQDLDKSPNIAVVLDIKEDHLDYHKNRKEYIDAKINIVRYQKKKDYTVINLDYFTSYKFAVMSPTKNDWYFSRRKSVDLGCYVEWTPKGKEAHFGKIILRTKKKDFEICKTYDITLRGEHNLENICAAVTASYLAGADIESIKKVVPKFKGLEHRLEFVGEKNGVKFYNDSFSTTPDTTIAAIKSFSEPIILIAGGSEKGADYTDLGREISKSNAKTLITIGKTGPKIKLKVKSKKLKIIEKLNNMRDIIKTAVKDAKPGDVILLSPASASFDMFRNYKDRGEQFKKEVEKII